MVEAPVFLVPLNDLLYDFSTFLTHLVCSQLSALCLWACGKALKIFHNHVGPVRKEEKSANSHAPCSNRGNGTHVRGYMMLPFEHGISSIGFSSRFCDNQG
jgi:hypothetical protein